MLSLLVLLLGLACSTEGLVVTLTPAQSSDTMESTMTTLPTVVYPTLAPYFTETPTASPGVVCDTNPVQIICKATACVVRNDPRSGQESVAYTTPNKTVLDGAVVCICSSCAEFEKEWFYLGSSGDKQFWAIKMGQVWEVYNGE